MFGTNDRYYKTTCRMQNSGHRATLKQIHFQAITLLFMLGFKYVMDIFYPLIVILWGASIGSTDILVYIDEISFLKHYWNAILESCKIIVQWALFNVTQWIWRSFTRQRKYFLEGILEIHLSQKHENLWCKCQNSIKLHIYIYNMQR